ncbi:restriction endonuclease subunit S [Anaerobiospirillum succiniciproducens]|uniref:restriction endonuclease subunit S n=1 Tax=Anaerobiospirillum succiniciproducens TaxID=13335 RepID=UPI00248EA256|nr:restriction endonuclease subunit S [Anaerobiospirillum succiniciproducens]
MSVREMKSSGVEWIGDIPSSWHITKIKYAYLIISGNGFPISMQGKDTGDFPVFKASDISINHFCTARNSANYITKQESHSFKVLSKGTIIFPKIGEALKKNNRAILGVNACVDNNCQGLVPVNMHDRYSLYLLSCIDMNWFNNDGTVPCIDNSKLKNCYIPSPVKQEQTAIAYYLDSKCAEIDTLTAEIEKQIETLQEYKKSVITEAVTKGLDPNVKMKESSVEWIGSVPKNWKVIAAKHCVNIENGSDPVTDGDTPVYGSGAESFRRCGEFKLGPSVLIGRKGTINIPRYITGKFWNVDTAFNVYSKNETVIKLKYYYYLSTSFDYKRYMNQTTLPGMTRTAYENMRIPLPSVIEQQQIIEFLDNRCSEIDTLISDKHTMLSSLAQFKQSLIYEYVTGKKTVPNA